MNALTRVRRVESNGIRLNIAEAGPEDGPLVLLLHGFPESWYGWRHQIDPLAAGGYRVVAVDQRGYGASDKPAGVESYRLDDLVGDVVGLIKALGRDRALIVGHDWGGIVAWAAIERHPERFERAVILNAPHPAVMQRAVRSDLEQIRRSWYVLAFQIPWLPEWILGRHHCRTLERALIATSRAGAFDQGDIELARAAWEQPGAIRAMLHWYRAGFRGGPISLPDPPIAVPTLILWGVADHALGVGLARSSFAQCRDAEIEWFEGATHWLAHEEPGRVSRAILDYFAIVRLPDRGQP